MEAIRILALADDLTGALEAGARIHGSIVTTDPAVEAPMLVLDTETRHLPPAEAAQRIEQVCRPAGVVYKKTDSTLRGNIAAELAALALMYPGRRIAYIGAYPALGRTVRGGCLYVDAIPVHQTAFARDPLNPITSSNIRELLAGLNCVVYDGETEDDVARAVSEARKNQNLLAGPASLLGPAGVPANLHARRVLIVNGSLHPVSIRQLEYARARGIPAGWRILTESRAPAPLVRDILDREDFDTLIVFGGDTAFAIATALGVSVFEPAGEVMPGVPASRMRGRAINLISKAGGFGGDDLLLRLARILNAQ